MEIKNEYAVVIPKIFTIKNYTIRLKRDLKGYIFVYSNHLLQFAGDAYKIILDIDTGTGMNVNNFKDIIKELILDTYLKNVNTTNQLSETEVNILRLIDYVIDNTIKSKTVLLLGYNYDYPNTIRSSIERIGVRCDTLLLDNNIEIYHPNYSNIERNSKPIFTMIEDKIESSDYHSFIIDIPNLVSFKSFPNTKKLLKYLDNRKKKMMIISSGSIYNINDIFGERYAKIAIEKKYIIGCADHMTIQEKISHLII